MRDVSGWLKLVEVEDLNNFPHVFSELVSRIVSGDDRGGKHFTMKSPSASWVTSKTKSNISPEV